MKKIIDKEIIFFVRQTTAWTENSFSLLFVFISCCVIFDFFFSLELHEKKIITECKEQLSFLENISNDIKFLIMALKTQNEIVHYDPFINC